MKSKKFEMINCRDLEKFIFNGNHFRKNKLALYAYSRDGETIDGRFGARRDLENYGGVYYGGGCLYAEPDDGYIHSVVYWLQEKVLGPRYGNGSFFLMWLGKAE